MKNINSLYLKLMLMLTMFAAVSCGDDDESGQFEQYNLRDLTVLDYVQNGAKTQQGAFNTLLAAVEKAGLSDALASGTITLFAPTDAAFEAAGIDVRDVDAAALADILTYHVIGSAVESDALGGPLTTVNGDAFNVSGTCINGFATVGGSVIDVNLSNGVVHSIDNVLIPPTGNLVGKVAEFATAAEPEFTLLQAALVRSGLDATLGGATRFTVFAPTDAAFTSAGLDQATIDATDPADLADILLFHVLEGEVFSCALESGLTATAAGSLEDTRGFTITVDDPVTVNGSEVTTVDVLASNGVIHVVDAVIFPELTIEENMNQSNPGFIQFYRTHRFFELLGQAGVTYDINDEVILYAPSTDALDFYLDGIGETVASLTQEEAKELVDRHTFDVLSQSLADQSFVENILGEKFLFNSNSDGDFLNILYSRFGFSTLDGSFVADTDRSGLGFGFLAFGSYLDEPVYNGYITTTNVVLDPLPANTIVDELVADGGYTALVAAATKTGLAATLAADNYTIFAPSDAAFSAIGYTAATIDALDEVDDADEIASLEAILLNHVSTSLLPATSILDAGSITTVGGLVIELEVDGGGDIVVVDSTIEEGDNTVVSGGDLLTANGIIHGSIDKVLN